jgi:hypothetical protein
MRLDPRGSAVFVILCSVPAASAAPGTYEPPLSAAAALRTPSTPLKAAQSAVIFTEPEPVRTRVTWGTPAALKKSITLPPPKLPIPDDEPRVEYQPYQPQPIVEQDLAQIIRDSPRPALLLLLASILGGSTMLAKMVWRPWSAAADPRYYG